MSLPAMVMGECAIYRPLYVRAAHARNLYIYTYTLYVGRPYGGLPQSSHATQALHAKTSPLDVHKGILTPVPKRFAWTRFKSLFKEHPRGIVGSPGQYACRRVLTISRVRPKGLL